MAGKVSAESATDGNDAQETSSSGVKKPKQFWMVRPCDDYYDEYSDCKSFKARFHQYFVAGETADCAQWRSDYDNCIKWDKTQDETAITSVIESEKSRIRQRLQGHYNNDVWKPRKEAPADWDSELPPEILKAYQGSFLKQKADAIKKGEEVLGDVDENIRNTPFFDTESATTTSMCAIL